MSGKTASRDAASSKPIGGKRLVPNELAIETVFGCNLSCPMCFIDMPSRRDKGVMPMDLFHSIVDRMAPHVNDIERVDLWSLGEPLLDPYLFERIQYLKDKRFRNLAISTNADLMDEEKQTLLLQSGIETIIVSIDGVKKETHEAIRRGADFDRVVKNVESVIRLRDEGNYATRFIVRFIRQDTNRDQWDAFKTYWNEKLNQKKKDFVALYDMHNHGGYVASKDDLLNKDQMTDAIERKPCHHIYSTLIILADGSVALCSADFLEAKFDLGNVKQTDPVDVFNSDAFNKIREIHSSGRKRSIDLCANCTALYSEQTRERGWETP